jgi:hypothetical protein
MPAPLDCFATLALSKSGRNISNPEAAEAFAAGLIQERLSRIEGSRARSIEAWLQTTARKAWIKRAPAVMVSEQEALDLEAQGKAWARPAFATGTLSRIELGDEERREAMEVVDYLMSEAAPRTARLSFEDALSQSKAWHQALARQKVTQEDPLGTELYHEMADGRRWVKVISAPSLAREGALMRHCVGSYAEQVERGSCQILSLRDKANKPLLTVEAVGVDKEGDRVSFDQGTGVVLAQIRGPSNAMPGQEHAEALRSLLDKFADDGRPIERADELTSSGLVIHKETQKLCLFSELEDGYKIDARTVFNRRVPDGVERPLFDEVTLLDARLPELLEVKARKLSVVGCSGSKVHVRLDGFGSTLRVEGVENFQEARFAGHQVKVEGQSPKRHWMKIPGSSDRDSSVAMALLGLGPQPDRIVIEATLGAAVGVRARELAVEALRGEPELDYTLDRCVYETSSCHENATKLNCLEKGEGLKDQIPPGSQLQYARGAMQDFMDQFQRAPLEELAEALRASSRALSPKKRLARQTLADQVGAISTQWISSYHRPGTVVMSQGNLVAFSMQELGEVEKERMDRQARALSGQKKGQPWMEALAGDLDPSKIPVRLEDDGFDGVSFGLAEWARAFEARCPALARAARKGQLQESQCRDDPEAFQMLGALARGRVQMDESQAKALWSKAGGSGSGWNFGAALEDEGLERHGAWRPAASLCFVATPVDEDWEPDQTVVKKESVLGKSLGKLRDALEEEDERLEGDLDEVAQRHLAQLATMALAWPLDDVRLAAPPAIAQEVFDAIQSQPVQPQFALACVALGVATAKVSGEPKRAVEQSQQWLGHLGKMLGLSAATLESNGKLVDDFLANHLNLDQERHEASLLGLCARARGMDLKTWLEDSGGDLAPLLKAQQARPLEGADFEALVAALGDEAPAGLSEALAKARASRAEEGARVNPFALMERDALISRVESLCFDRATAWDKAMAMQAARPFMRADLGENLFGEISPEGLWKADAFWTQAGVWGGAAPLARDALVEVRMEALLEKPASFLLALMDPDELSDPAEEAGQDDPKRSPKRLVQLREAVTDARKKHGELPDASMVSFEDLPITLTAWADALAQGAAQGDTVGQTAKKAMGDQAESWTLRSAMKQRKLMAQEISNHRDFTVERRVEMINALTYHDHQLGFRGPRR